MKPDKEIIAKEVLCGTTYYYKVGKYDNPNSPQLKYQILLSNNDGKKWEPAGYGACFTYRDACARFAERYTYDLDNLTVYNEELRLNIEKRIKEEELYQLEKKREEAAQRARDEEWEKNRKARNEFMQKISEIKLPGKKGKIQLYINKGETKDQEATIYGTYAVFKEVSEGDTRYNITHVRSGLHLVSINTLKQARIIAKAFHLFFPEADKLRYDEEAGKKARHLMDILKDDPVDVPDYFQV